MSEFRLAASIMATALAAIPDRPPPVRRPWTSGLTKAEKQARREQNAVQKKARRITRRGS